jgi:uncharacterized membrane protein YphA (DoxX/SURF4 family)
MLSVFPDLLFIGSALAPLVLRVTLALALFGLFRYHQKHKNAALVVSIAPYLKSYAKEIYTIGTYGILIVSALLFIGLLTQVAALLGAVICLKMLYFKKHYPEIAPESKNYYILLLVISLIVVFTGAGPYAFDIPL